MRIITSAQLIKEMGAGWNAGNSLDACKCGGLESETSWNNPPLTKELFGNVSRAGFNVIRIPVTWCNHFTDESGSIDRRWLDRVQEVVDYAYSQGVFVILNTHHENWFYTSMENYPAASRILKSVWNQISERFEPYDERLVFEGLNEPRKIKSPDEWNGGDEEARKVVNLFNADFVDTVRGSGKNNKNRHLLLATYCGSCTENVMRELAIPDDDKIIAGVHSYQPWSFAAALEKDGGVCVFEDDNPEFLKAIDETFAHMKHYISDKGIPLIIGEYGCIDRSNEKERIKYISYMKKKAQEVNARLIWWDNGYPNSFGLFDRKSGAQVYPAIIRAAAK